VNVLNLEVFVEAERRYFFYKLDFTDPGNAKRFLIIRPPLVFRLKWNAFKPFIDENTKEKIHNFGPEQQATQFSPDLMVFIQEYWTKHNTNHSYITFQQYTRLQALPLCKGELPHPRKFALLQENPDLHNIHHQYQYLRKGNSCSDLHHLPTSPKYQNQNQISMHLSSIERRYWQMVLLLGLMSESQVIAKAGQCTFQDLEIHIQPIWVPTMANCLEKMKVQLKA